MSRSLIVAAPLLLAAPAPAQEADAPAPTFSLPPSGSAPAPSQNRQGPELDVYRDTTPRATPPVVAPTVAPPPAPVQAAPAQTAPSQPVPSRPAETRPTRETPARARQEDERATAKTPPRDASSPAEAASAPPSPVAAPAAPPISSGDGVAPGAPAAAAAAAASEPGDAWPWIVGGMLALMAIGGGLFWRARRRGGNLVEEPAGAPPSPPAARPAPPPAPEAASPTAPPAPVPAPPPPADPPAAARPWLDMDLFVAQARFSLMGVTVAYRLTLHNRGDAAARDVMVRGTMGNAGAQQQALLESFFAGADGLPLHSAVGIAPGETVTLAGELRLPPDRIVPVTIGERQLLIPLAAFDAAYRWGVEDDAPAGEGRTARAFIVGQEQEPPADRLAPLRLDQGPRQYRRPAARAAAELTPA